MGFFNRFGNAFSGKISRHDELIATNSGEFLGKVLPLETGFISAWATVNLSFVTSLLSALMFPGVVADAPASRGSIFEDFSMNVGSADRRRTNELFRLVTSFNLSMFLLNQSSERHLRVFGHTPDSFSSSIFSIFDFTVNDVESFKARHALLAEGNVTQYFRTLYELMMQQGFAVQTKAHPIRILAFAEFMGNSYSSHFVTGLERKLLELNA